MELTPAQLAQYERDGFLIFPDLFGPAEIAVLRQEVARLSRPTTEEVFREHTGGVKSIFRVHEEDGATRSAPFRALVRTPRVLRPVQQVLGTDETYVYHTKINAKPAIEGTIWMWHQDYNSWSKDGCPTPEHGDVQCDAERHDRIRRRAVYHSRQSQARPAGIGLGHVDRLQIMGHPQGEDDRGHAQFAAAGSGDRARRHRGAVPLQCAARLGA